MRQPFSPFVAALALIARTCRAGAYCVRTVPWCDLPDLMLSAAMAVWLIPIAFPAGHDLLMD